VEDDRLFFSETGSEAERLVWRESGGRFSRQNLGGNLINGRKFTKPQPVSTFVAISRDFFYAFFGLSAQLPSEALSARPPSAMDLLPNRNDASCDNRDGSRSADP
jgi:hypothetical protein